MKSYYKILSLAACAGALFLACGDDVTQVLDQGEMANLACSAAPLEDSTGLKIICGGDSVGVILNGVNGENGKNGKDGKNGTSCTTESLKDSSGVKILCDGDSVGVVLNGKNGKNGKDGENGQDGQDGQDGLKGQDGSSCSAEAIADGSGMTIFCDGKKVGVILNGKNGKDGEDGDNGDNGTSCTAETLEDNSGMNIVCNGNVVGTILNGKNGKDGKSCTAAAREDASGMDILCDGEKVGTVLNGNDGQEGKEGTSCVVKESTFESLTVTCGETDYDFTLPGAIMNPELNKTYNRTIAFSTENRHDAIEFTVEELDSVKFQPTGKSFKFYADEFNFQIVDLGWLLHEKNITLTNLQSPYVKVSYKTDENSNYIFVTPDNILSSSSAQPTSSAPPMPPMSAGPPMSEEYYVPSTATSTAEPKTINLDIPGTMTALVDLRKETIAVVSIQSTYKYVRIQNLLKAGVQIEEAIQQANNEFAEAFTFGDEYENNNYGALDDFNVAKLNNKFGTDFFKEVVNQKVAYEFDEKIPFGIFFEYIITKVDDYMILLNAYAEQGNFNKKTDDGLGLITDKYYWSETIGARIFAKSLGFDICTDQNKNDVNHVTNENSEFYDYYLICYDNYWTKASAAQAAPLIKGECNQEKDGNIVYYPKNKWNPYAFCGEGSNGYEWLYTDLPKCDESQIESNPRNKIDPSSDITYSFTCDGTEWQGVRLPSENSSSSEQVPESSSYEQVPESSTSGGPVPVETEVPVEP